MVIEPIEALGPEPLVPRQPRGGERRGASHATHPRQAVSTAAACFGSAPGSAGILPPEPGAGITRSTAGQTVSVKPAQYVVDADGVVRGGIRTPAVDVPVAKLSGLGRTGGTQFCQIFGTIVPFTDAQPATLSATTAASSEPGAGRRCRPP